MGIPSILIVSIGSALLAIGGFMLTRRLVKPIDLDEHQSFLDAMLSIVGTLVSILLGLLVAAAMDRYQNLIREVDSEAGGVACIFRLAHGFPEADRHKIQTLCTRYSYLVQNTEWPAMTKGQMSHDVFLTFGKLQHAIITYVPKNDGETNVQAALIEALDVISHGRRERALALRSDWAHHLMPVLVICSLIVIIFTYLYVKRGATLHAVLIGFVAVALGGNLGLILLLSRPFDGDWKIQPTAFELNRQLLEEYKRSHELHLHQPGTPDRALELSGEKSDAPAP